MPKSIYIDENGNEQILSSSPSALSGLQDTDIQSATSGQVLAYDGSKWANSSALEYKSGDQIVFAFQQLLCRIDSNGKRLTVFIPLSKIVNASSVSASGAYLVYDINAGSLLSVHDISNDTQASTITNNGVVLTITLTTALSVTLGYGVIELRNTFKLTFA